MCNLCAFIVGRYKQARAQLLQGFAKAAPAFASHHWYHAPAASDLVKFTLYDSSTLLSAGGFWKPYLTYISISIMYALVAGGLVSFVEPLAAGSGIAEVKTYLNGVHIRGLLAVRRRAQTPLLPCMVGDHPHWALGIVSIDEVLRQRHDVARQRLSRG